MISGAFVGGRLTPFGPQAVTDSGAVSTANERESVRTHPKECPSARNAVRFYQRRYIEWRAKMGAGREPTRLVPHRKVGVQSCPRIRYLAERWSSKAFRARLEFERWHAYQYDWRSWLPARWKAIIACETFSNFRHNSGTYQGAFGFHYGTWDRFRLSSYPSEAYDATPRQQYEVALAIYRRFGLSGWGCA